MTNPAPMGPPTMHCSEDTLIDLAAGLLRGAEADGLLAHLRTCDECERRFQSVVADRERGRALAGGSPVSASAARAARHRGRRTALTAGAVAIAAALLITFVTRPVSHAPAGAWLPPAGQGLDPRTRGGGAEGADVWKGIAAYEAHDLTRALPLLSKARSADPGLDEMRRVYLASAYLLGDRPREAVESLEGLDLDRLPHPWRGEAWWVEADALARMGRKEDARRALQRTALEKGAAGDRARTLLARVGP